MIPINFHRLFPHQKRDQGFTLIEVIIAISILSFISLYTARMIQQGLKSRAKIQAEMDIRSGLTSALQLMTRDIAKAFHYRDINVELFNAAQKRRREKLLAPPAPPKPEPGKPPPPPVPPTPPRALTPDEEAELKVKEEKIYTRFMGEADKLDFTSLDLHRNTKNAKVSDQVEIGYYLDTCASRVKKDASTECLWRRYAQIIDEDVKDGGRRSVILENVKSLKFRFLTTGDSEEWKDIWQSEGGSSDTQDKFPQAVEITLVVNDTRFTPPKELGMTVVAPIEFPNNKPNEQKTGAVN